MLKKSLILAIVFLVTSTSLALATDANLVGTWKSVVNKPEGTWIMTWTVNPDFTYHSSVQGPFPLPEENGKLKADKGQWSISAASGRVDAGSYTLSGDNLSLTGKKDTTKWIRQHIATVPFPQRQQQQQPQHSTAGNTTTGNTAFVYVDPYPLPEQRLLEISSPPVGQRTPLPAKAFFDRGMQLKDRDDWIGAATAFSQALNAQPNMIDAHYQRGVCLTKSDLNPAGGFPETLRRSLPHLTKGSTQMKFIAIGDFTHVINAQPNNAKAWCMRSMAKSETGAFNAALADASKAIALDPNYSAAYGLRGYYKTVMGQDGSADFARCYQLNAGLKEHFEYMRAEGKAHHADMVRWQREREERARQAALNPGPAFDPYAMQDAENDRRWMEALHLEGLGKQEEADKINPYR